MYGNTTQIQNPHLLSQSTTKASIMEIEVTTTKKKITKAIVIQMLVTYRINTLQYAIDNGSILGTVYNSHKHYQAVALVKGENDYFIIPILPYRVFGNVSGTVDINPTPRIVFNNKTTGGSNTKAFENEEQLVSFTTLYDTIVSESKKTHIYL